MKYGMNIARARLLYYEIRRRGYRIPHNKIHSYLKERGRTIPNPNKQKKRKRCRHENSKPRIFLPNSIIAEKIMRVFLYKT